MPGTPKPVGASGGLPVVWNAVTQKFQSLDSRVTALEGAHTPGVFDKWGNAVEVTGSNLNQIVTIGASHTVAGVKVATGIADGTAGSASLSGPSTTTITLTQGSTSATVGTVSGAALDVGQVIGAANVNDPSNGTPTAAITPGTTISAISGSSVTLSQPAAESGTNLYCAAGRYILSQDTGWVAITLGPNVTELSGYGIPSARLQGDIVRLKGAVHATATTFTLGTVPVGLRPTAWAYFANQWTVDTSGVISSQFSLSSGQNFGLDGITYSLS